VSEMTGFGWLVVVIPVFVIGIYLLTRRHGTRTPFNSIYSDTAGNAHEQASAQSGQVRAVPTATESIATAAAAGRKDSDHLRE